MSGAERGLKYSDTRCESTMNLCWSRWATRLNQRYCKAHRGGVRLTREGRISRSPWCISISTIRQSIETKLDSQDHYEEIYRPKEKTKDPLQSRWICDLWNIIPASKARPWQKSTLQRSLLHHKARDLPHEWASACFRTDRLFNVFQKSLVYWVLGFSASSPDFYSAFIEKLLADFGVQGQRLSPRTEGRLRPLFFRVKLDQRSSHFHVPFPNYTVSLHS